MSRICEYTGKKRSVGHNVSHSQRKTKREFRPNVRKKKLVDPVTGREFTAVLSTTAIRTFAKKPGELVKFAKKKLAQIDKRAAKRAKLEAKMPYDPRPQKQKLAA